MTSSPVTCYIRRADSPGAPSASAPSDLLLHGAVKVVLVIALLLNKLWAYPCMIVVLLIFIGYQLYRIALQPSAGLVLLTAFDVVIVALTWREYRRQRRSPNDRSSGTAGVTSAAQVVER